MKTVSPYTKPYKKTELYSSRDKNIYYTKLIINTIYYTNVLHNINWVKFPDSISQVF
jgi:hypothetical protein